MAYFPFCLHCCCQCLIIFFLHLDLLVHLILFLDPPIIHRNIMADKKSSDPYQNSAYHLQKSRRIFLRSMRQNTAQEQCNRNKPYCIPIILTFNPQKRFYSMYHKLPETRIKCCIHQNSKYVLNDQSLFYRLISNPSGNICRNCQNNPYNHCCKPERK